MKIELTKPMARAIIDMEDIGYSEGLGPRTEASSDAWDRLLKWAEDLTGQKAVRDKRRTK